MKELNIKANENELEIRVYIYADGDFSLRQDKDHILLSPKQLRKLVPFIMENIGSKKNE